MLKIGASKKDTNIFEYGIPFFGYGDENHIAKDIDTPIHARTFVIQETESDKKIAIVVIELGSVSDMLKKAVINSLIERNIKGFEEKNVIISATHTHSAPAGHSGYIFYDLTAGGFSQPIFNKLVYAITSSIIEAEKNAVPAVIRYGEGEFDPSIEVVFNASMKAYHANPDVKKYSMADWHLATDRAMSLLRFDSVNGNPIGAINWFGVHTTSVGKDNYKMSADNKGHAALYMEDDLDNKFVAAFAQKPCADTSPNFRWNAKRNKMCGKFDDDYESARYNGKLQYEKAKEIFNAVKKENPLQESIYSSLEYVDLSNTIIDPEFSQTNNVNSTAPAALGVAFARGMTDGFGLDKYSLQFLRLFSFISKSLSLFSAKIKGEKKWKEAQNKFLSQGNKSIFLETTHPAIFGIGPSFFANMLAPFDKIMSNLKQKVKDKSIHKPWTPHLLPIQLITIGQVAICGIPGEISITAGKRLQKTCLNILEKAGITHIIISPYSNGYAGYITTEEEYQVQAYEGGHTMFGKNTFAAFQTHFKKLCLKSVNKIQHHETTISNSH